MAFLVPEPYPAEVRLRSAYLAQRRTVNGLVHIPLTIDQDHMDIISRISKLNGSDKSPAIAMN